MTIPLRDEWRSAVTDGTLYIDGLRPGAFEDAEFVDDDKRSRGVTFEVTVDMVEWLGNEQYAFVPFEATPEIKQQLAELANELDSEQLRTQLCVELDPLSRVRSGDKATLWMDAESAPVRSAVREELDTGGRRRIQRTARGAHRLSRRPHPDGRS